MKTILFLTIIVLATAYGFPHMASAEMYIWTDANGVKHYSDTAPASPVENLETGNTVAHDEEYYRQADYEKARESDYMERLADIQKAKDRYNTKVWEHQRESKKSAEEYESMRKDREIRKTKANILLLEGQKNSYENLKGDMYTTGGRKWADKHAKEAGAELDKEKTKLRDVELHGN